MSKKRSSRTRSRVTTPSTPAGLPNVQPGTPPAEPKATHTKAGAALLDRIARDGRNPDERLTYRSLAALVDAGVLSVTPDAGE